MVFFFLGNDLGEDQLHTSNNELTLAKHNIVHKELIAYSELMHWTKAMDRKTYDGLVKVYTSSLNKVYDRNIRLFFEQARQLIGISGTLKDEMNTSVSNKFKGQQSAKPSSINQSTYGILGINRDLWSQGLQPSERQKFDTILEKVLAELEPVALGEQLFCVAFFQLDVLSPTTKNTQTTLDANDGNDSMNNSIHRDEKDSGTEFAIFFLLSLLQF